MKTIKIIVLCLLSCILSACPEQSEEYIMLVNKSERDIACQWNRLKSSTSADTLFRDRVLIYEILKDSSYLFHSIDDTGWKADFNFTPYLLFLIMDNETYSKYKHEPRDTIRKYVPILHRYWLSLEDLEQMNWTIVYPPKE